MEKTKGTMSFRMQKGTPTFVEDDGYVDSQETDFIKMSLYDSELDHIQPILNKFSLFLKACGFTDYYVGVSPHNNPTEEIWSDY